jgi:4-hydroxybenzoate polyprenyltransferase
MAEAERASAVAVPAHEGAARAVLAAMRPRQWPKNLLVFAGILFAAEYDEPAKWAAATGAFVAYCAASSAAYIFNDVLDAKEDRQHELKRSRPVASGALSPERALGVSAFLAIVGIAVVAWFGWGSVAYLTGFLALQAAYSVWLKHVVLIDVMAIAALFVIRAAAGAEAVNVRISPWLIVCTALLALFLALAKRRGELVSTADAGGGRAVLDGYSFALVDQLVSIVAACTIVAYSLYTFEAREGSAMMATIPFVVFGLFRYLMLIHRHDLGEEPENVLLTDAPILVTIALWALTSGLILGYT